MSKSEESGDFSERHTVPFPIRLDLVPVSEGEFGVDVFFGYGEGIGGFLGEAHSPSGNNSLHDGISHGSLIPEDSSQVGDGEGAIGSGVVSRFDVGDIQTLGEIGQIGNAGRIPGITGIASKVEKRDCSEDHKDGDDDDKFNQCKPAESCRP